jgi:hypothetical protein
VLAAEPSGRLARVMVRFRSAQGPLMILVVVGVVFAAGSNSFTHTYSSDVALFQRYANAALASPLFHSLPREYPAAALAVFLAPVAFPLPYALGFAVVTAAAGVGLVLSSDGLAEYPGWSRRTCYYFLFGTATIVFARYDVFAALTAVLAVEGARRGRWGRAWAWAVLGGMLKLFPFLLLPGFLLAERAQTGRWAFKRVAAACVPIAAVSAAQLVIAPGSLLSPLTYELRRGFELTSLQGSLAFLLNPIHAHWMAGFDSVEVAGPGQLAISLMATIALVAGLLIIWALAARGKLSVVAASLAILSLAVLADKSFAPQYLVWLVPFWAYWPMRRGWVAAAVLTSVIYPILYGEAQQWGPSFYLPTAFGVARNAILLVTTIAWLREQLQLRKDRTDLAAADSQTQDVTGSSSPGVPVFVR